MSQEKFEAFAESASAMATEIVKANLALYPSIFRIGWTVLYAMWAPTAFVGGAGRGRPASAAGIVPRIVSKSVPRVIAKGLAPVHRRAKANAQRLGRTRR